VSQFKTKSAPKKPYPTTPQQKVQRRLAVAKKTGRLDLSTQLVGPFAETPQPSDPDTGAAGDNSETEEPPSVLKSPSSPSPSSPKSPKSQFINQWREPSVPKPSEMRVIPSTSTVEYYLEEIPSEVFAINGLTEIWLCNNPLKSIPSALGDLHALQVLSLANVGLTSIPLEVSGLISLRRLYLQKNLIVTIPEELSSLTLLTDFNISSNQLSGPEPPAAVYQFKQIAYLNIASNPQLTSISEQITLLSSLALLDITDTNIRQLPQNISRRMPHLLILGQQPEEQQSGPEQESTEGQEEGKQREVKKPPPVSSCGITKEEEQELLGFLKHRAKQSKVEKEKSKLKSK
jgi:Leucine-rich repeat (LRR) protein